MVDLDTQTHVCCCLGPYQTLARSLMLMDVTPIKLAMAMDVRP